MPRTSPRRKRKKQSTRSRVEKEAEEAKATANTRLLEEIRDTLKALSEKG